MTINIQPTAFKTISSGEVLLVSAARFQNSLPFSGAFEVFDLYQCITKVEGDKLIASVNCTTEGVPLTENSILDIELIGDYQGSIEFSGDVITCISIHPSIHPSISLTGR